MSETVSSAKLAETSRDLSDSEATDGAKRYDLRRRQSPLKSVHSSTPAREKSKSKVATPAHGSSSAPATRCCMPACFSKYFYSGYLRFTLKQLVFIVAASILLLLALFFINSFNLANFKENFIYRNVCAKSREMFNAVVGYGHKAVDLVTSRFK